LTARIFIKLIVAVVCILVVALAVVDVMVAQLAEQTYLDQRRRALTEKVNILASISDNGFTDYTRQEFAELGRMSGTRITVIDQTGKVLADSQADPAAMDNHRTRPELAVALRGQLGSSTRMSPTVGVQALYVAAPISVGAIRLAVPLSDIKEQVAAIRSKVLTAMVYAFIPTILVAALFARIVSSKLGDIIKFAGQLADGGFRRRLRWSGKGEMGILATKLDETASKLENMFDQIKREHKELARVERIRKDFVINVSHELRTPLASIQGYTETLLDGALEDPENNVRFLRIIKQNAERLTNLTSDLLTLCRIELKQQKFQFAEYDINQIICDSADTMRPIAEKNSIELVTDLAPEGTTAYCDPKGIHQALSNLLDNAIKYTPAGGTVTVSALCIQMVGDEPDFIEIAVQDTGQGIPKEDLPRLFERFYRVDKARSRQLGGTGLGLSIVKHLARSHGGDVRVESEDGQGSTFAFTVPVRATESARVTQVKSELTVL